MPKFNKKKSGTSKKSEQQETTTVVNKVSLISIDFLFDSPN